ncbi:MAG TPA: DUF1573 domain-containing protein [Nitrospirota bacterium]
MKFGLAVIAMVLFAGSVTALDQQGPRIEIKELHHDLGKVTQGAQASHVFEVRSVGSEPLMIERVVSS